MLSGINFHPIFLIVVGLLLALFGYKIQKIVYLNIKKWYNTNIFFSID